MRTAYGWLLRFYPAPFYDRFARDMYADFNDGYSAAGHDGLLTRMGFTLRSYCDLVASVVRQWQLAESFVIWRAAILIALSLWALVFVVAALEWPRGPATLAFVVQLFLALTVCAALTIGLALRNRASIATNPVSHSRNS